MDPVPVTPTADLVISMRINCCLADGARSPLIGYLQPQPVLKTHTKLPVLEVETEGL